MDFSQTEEASERYAPQSATVRSEQISESGTFGAAAAPPQGIPGSASNTPTAANTVAPGAANGQAATAAPDPAGTTAAAAAANAVSGPGSRTAVRNYEMDRVLTHTRQAPGRIRRVTAAVLVDNVPQAAAGNGRKPTQRAFDAAELKRIESLVQQAIGFDGQRGDVVSVVNAPFARGAADVAADDLPIWDHPRARDLLRTALGGLAVLLLIFVVLRPAFRTLLAPRGRPAEPVVQVLEADEEIPVSISAAPQPGRMTQQQAAMNFDEKLEVARTAVNTDAKRVAQVMRGWVEQDG
jgi:flagellar M-ring protein FliF